MSSRNRTRPQRDEIKALRENDIGHGTFYCEPCDHYGWSKNGGLAKHQRSNKCIAKHQSIPQNHPQVPQFVAPVQPLELEASETIRPMSLATQPRLLQNVGKFSHSPFYPYS
jgi:hypothetical protein